MPDGAADGVGDRVGDGAADGVGDRVADGAADGVGDRAGADSGETVKPRKYMPRMSSALSPRAASRSDPRTHNPTPCPKPWPEKWNPCAVRRTSNAALLISSGPSVRAMTRRKSAPEISDGVNPASRNRDTRADSLRATTMRSRSSPR